MNMTISTVDSASAVEQAKAPTQGRASRTSSVPPPQNAAASATISRGGELMSKLKQLQSTDPAQFKSVMADLSQKLKSAASQSGDAKLGQLADRFAQAAQSGDLSSLQPKSGGPHKHGGHGAGGPKAGGLDAVFASALDEVNKALGSATAAAPAEAGEAEAPGAKG
jgi:hypothetical protein